MNEPVRIYPRASATSSAEVIVTVPSSATVELPEASAETRTAASRRASVGMLCAVVALGAPSAFGVRRFFSDPSPVSPIRAITPADTGTSTEQPLGGRLLTLQEMPNGWDDGQGIAPQLQAISWAREFARHLGHNGVLGLHASPSLDGGIVLSRQIGNSRWSLEVDADGEPILIVVPPGGAAQAVTVENAAAAAESLRRFVSSQTGRYVAS
jgi:hypothetical protein